MRINKCEIFFATTSYIKFHVNEMIEKLKEEMSEINFYVSEMPENAKDKDIKLFLVNLREETSILKPKIILMLGRSVYNEIWKDKSLKTEDYEKYTRFYYKKIDGVYYVPIKTPLKYNTLTDSFKEQYIKDLVLFLSNLLEKEEEDEL